MFLFYFGSSDIRTSILDPKVSFEELIDFALSPSEDAGRVADQKNNILGCLFWILSSSDEKADGTTAFFDLNGQAKTQLFLPIKKTGTHS